MTETQKLKMILKDSLQLSIENIIYEFPIIDIDFLDTTDADRKLTIKLEKIDIINDDNEFEIEEIAIDEIYDILEDVKEDYNVMSFDKDEIYVKFI